MCVEMKCGVKAGCIFGIVAGSQLIFYEISSSYLKGLITNSLRFFAKYNHATIKRRFEYHPFFTTHCQHNTIPLTNVKAN
jgi:hypothetical protein